MKSEKFRIYRNESPLTVNQLQLSVVDGYDELLLPGEPGGPRQDLPSARLGLGSEGGLSLSE